MKKTIILFSFLFASILVFQSCNKYEDGPSFSLRSASGRLCNTWTIDKVYVADVDVTTGYVTSFKDLVMTFKKDNTYTKSFTDQNGATNSIEGTWAFSNDNVNLTISIYGIQIATFTILRLASKELWLRETYSSVNYDVHYMVK